MEIDESTTDLANSGETQRDMNDYAENNGLSRHCLPTTTVGHNPDLEDFDPFQDEDPNTPANISDRELLQALTSDYGISINNVV